MTVGELSRTQLRSRLANGGLRLRLGPFLVRVWSSLAAVEECLSSLYASHIVEPDGVGAHFSICADPPSTLRRFIRPQVQLTIDGREPFIPLPQSMAAPMLEAGLNWCIGSAAHQWLVIHAATLERGGRALLMPAPPGSGKSTLCAALVCRGWRLLSDEFALLDPCAGTLAPVPRPIALKEASIGLIRAWAPEAVFGPEVENNEGLTVSYMRPPAGSVEASHVTCQPGWIVVPTYQAGAATRVEQMSRAQALLDLADNSFNYNLHGRVGFERLVDVAEAAPCVTLQYSNLESGVRQVEALCGQR